MQIITKIIVWIFFSFSGLALAQQQNFIIGVQEPLYYSVEAPNNRTFNGYARELFDAFAQYKGYRFEYRVLPINELFRQLIAREVDFKYPDNPYWQYSLKSGVRLAYSDPIAPYTDGVFVAHNNLGKGLANIKKLGIIKGFTPFELEHLIQAGEINVIECESIKQLIEKAFAGKVDGIYGSVDVITAQLANINNINSLVFDPQLPYLTQSYTLSSATRPRVLEDLNVFLKTNATQLNQLKKKYAIESSTGF